MITSIFRKSKPINYIICFLLLLLAVFTAFSKYSRFDLNAAALFKVAAVFFCCFLSVLVLDFIVTKNSLSLKGNVEILLFSGFILCVPQVFLHWEIVLSNFFVLLALRRIVSLRSPKNPIKKLFDAGFLIGLASLFYFWAILFFILIFFALLFYAESDIKKWMASFLGLATTAILSISFSLLYNNDFFTSLNIDPIVNFDFNAYNSTQFIVAITLFLSFGLWSSLFYLKDLNKKMKTFRPSFKVVFIACIIAATIMAIAPIKTGGEFLFLFAPLSIVISNYIETIEEKWFKEVFVLMLLGIPFALLLL